MLFSMNCVDVRHSLLRHFVIIQLQFCPEVEAWAEKLEGGDGALLSKTRAEVVNWMWGSGLGKRKM